MDFIAEIYFTVNREELSDKANQKLDKKQERFEQHFGGVSSSVATLELLKDHDNFVCAESPSPTAQPAQSAHVGPNVQGLANLRKKATASANPSMTIKNVKHAKKLFARQRLAGNSPGSTGPATMTELMEISKDYTVQFSVREPFSPGYYTFLDAEPGRLKDPLAACSYDLADKPPKNPDPLADHFARLDSDWIDCEAPQSLFNNSMARVMEVDTIVFDKKRKCFFLITKKTKLPGTGSKWKVTGGLYPTNLTSDYHEHRAVFESLNLVTVPGTAQEACDGDKPCIGVFAPANPDTPVTMMLNGREVQVRLE
jgi:hypothetical protein